MRARWIGPLLALTLLAVGCRCNAPTMESDETAPAVQDGAPTPPPPNPIAGEDVREPVDAPEIAWAFSPKTLDVYRDTVVSFRVTNADALPEGFTFDWRFSDGSPDTHGPSVSHRFRGGLSDGTVTLSARDGDRVVYTGTRTVALERLPVVPLDDSDDALAPVDLSIPSRPATAGSREDGGGEDTSFRLAIIAESRAADGPQQGARTSDAVARLVDTVRPDIVIQLGGMVNAGTDEGEAWRHFHAAVTTPLRNAGVPFVPVAGASDVAAGFGEVWKSGGTRPRVTFVDDRLYPRRYAFTWAGAFFLVLDGATGEVTEDQIRWVRQQLAAARIYTARFVLTYTPLHKLTELGADEGAPQLDKQYRLYNLFLENNVTMLFSGRDEVYFKGHYGALRAVSVGNLAGRRRALSSDATPQGASFVVVDVTKGRINHVFAVAGPSFDHRLDESALPSEVKVYRYDPTFTPASPTLPMPEGVFDRD